MECEHLILLALFRQWDHSPKTARSLSTTLYQLKKLVETEKGHDLGGVLADHTDVSLTAAFTRLLEIKLVRFCPGLSEDVPKMYRPCESLVDEVYKKWAPLQQLFNLSSLVLDVLHLCQGGRSARKGKEGNAKLAQSS